MQMKYGAYQFEDNSLWTDHNRELIFDESGQPHSFRLRTGVNGRLSGNGQLDLIAKESALINALAIPNQDLLFLADNGQSTGISMPTGLSYTGVRIVEGPIFDSTFGAEYATIRSFRFVAEACYTLGGISRTKIISWRERVTFEGGGRKYVARNAVRGLPQVQLVYGSTVYTVTQTGEATGLLKYPQPAGPLFPNAAYDSPKIEYVSPDKVGINQYRNYGIMWTYTFYSTTPLIALPTQWPNL